MMAFVHQSQIVRLQEAVSSRDNLAELLFAKYQMLGTDPASGLLDWFKRNGSKDLFQSILVAAEIVAGELTGGESEKWLWVFLSEVVECKGREVIETPLDVLWLLKSRLRGSSTPMHLMDDAILRRCIVAAAQVAADLLGILLTTRAKRRKLKPTMMEDAPAVDDAGQII